MKNEIIFEYSSECMGRYGELETTKVIVLADFSDITKWPYQIKVEESIEESLDEEDDSNTVTFYKISKKLFDSIKSTIESHKELLELPNCIDYFSVMDGAGEHFEFTCSSFSKVVYGVSLLSEGHYCLDEDPDSQDNCAVLCRVYDEIKNLIDSEQTGILY